MDVKGGALRCSNVAYEYGYMNMGYDVQIKRADG